MGQKREITRFQGDPAETLRKQKVGLVTYTAFLHDPTHQCSGWYQSGDVYEQCYYADDPVQKYLKKIVVDYGSPSELPHKWTGGEITLNFDQLQRVSLPDPGLEFQLENERLKTQMIEQRRALLVARQSNDELNKKNDRLVEIVCDLTKSTQALQRALLAKEDSKICLYETHEGVVSEVVGDQIQVTFETENGPLRQVYHRSQFMGKKLPDEGEIVEANVFLSTKFRPRETAAEEEQSQVPGTKADFRTTTRGETIRVDGV
jgi:hypothetical protein